MASWSLHPAITSSHKSLSIVNLKQTISCSTRSLLLIRLRTSTSYRFYADTISINVPSWWSSVNGLDRVSRGQRIYDLLRGRSCQLKRFWYLVLVADGYLHEIYLNPYLQHHPNPREWMSPGKTNDCTFLSQDDDDDDAAPWDPDDHHSFSDGGVNKFSQTLYLDVGSFYIPCNPWIKVHVLCGQNV